VYGAGPVGKVQDEDEDEGQATWVDEEEEGAEDGAREGAEAVMDEDAEVGDADWADDDDEAKANAEKEAAEDDDAPAHEAAALDSDTDEGEDVATRATQRERPLSRSRGCRGCRLSLAR